MNPHDTLQRLQGHLPSKHQSGWDSYCHYSSYSDEAHSSGVGQKELSPPSHSVYSNKSEDEDPDGEPLEMLEEDAELERKKKRLREIEEQIIYKKASLALKTIGKSVKETTPPGNSRNEQPATLKNRVKMILLQRHSPSFLSKGQSQKERTSTPSQRKDGLLQEYHPLQLRVKALMKQRTCAPCVLPTNSEVPGVTLPHPSQSVAPPEKEENSANKGFLRFLSVLNKGVDIEFLSRIVNDDREDLPLSKEPLNIHLSRMDNKSNPCITSENHGLNSGASLQSHNWTNSVDRKSDSPSREQSLTERVSLPDAKETDRRGHSLRNSVIECSGRSDTPVAVKKKKEEAEETPQVGEQNEQLQNILKTLGLSLETQELSQLADRTQMRLYGKRHEGRQGTCRTAEQESQDRCSHRDNRKSPPSSSSRLTARNIGPSHRRRSRSRDYRKSPTSSSSSSSSSSSRSTARSFSPSRHSNQRRKYDGDHSRERDHLQNDGKEAQSHTDRAEIESKQISAYHHQYPQNQTFVHPASAFPDYSFSQYSHYTDPSTSYNSATDSQWTHPNLQRNFPSNKISSPAEGIMSFLNPDLSECEGQVGSTSASRCLKVISTVQSTNQHCMVQLKKDWNWKRAGTKRTNKRSARRQQKIDEWLQKNKVKSMKSMMSVTPATPVMPVMPATPVMPVKPAKPAKQQTEQEMVASQDDEGDSKTKLSENEQRDPTEEEIKANLRKKLEAFNKKMKHTSQSPHTSVMPPASSLTSEII